MVGFLTTKSTSVLITGVTQGSLGSQVLLQLSLHRPSLLILVGRNLVKLQGTELDIKTASPGVSTRLFELNFSSQRSLSYPNNFNLVRYRTVRERWALPQHRNFDHISWNSFSPYAISKNAATVNAGAYNETSGSIHCID